MSPYQVNRDGSGWSVTGPDVYLYHRAREICEAVAALLNGNPKAAAEWIEQWRSTG